MKNLPISATILLAIVLGCAPPTQNESTTKATPTISATPTQTPSKSMPIAIDEYRKFIRNIDKKGDIVKEISEGAMDGQIKIAVAHSFHSEPYQMRLQLAQKLWEGWAAKYSPNEPDKARIKITDLNGNEVGGSRVWAGSLIWVQEN